MRTGSVILPIVVGVSLCGVAGVLLYLLLNKEEDKVLTTTKKSKRIRLPSNVIPSLIGRGGSNIKEIQNKSGAHISFHNTVGGSGGKGEQDERDCLIEGSSEAISLAEALIQNCVSAHIPTQQITITIPSWTTGKIIGRGGENIRDICHTSGARVKMEQKEYDNGPASQKKVYIAGTPQQIQVAKDIIEQYVVMAQKIRDDESTRREPRGHFPEPVKTVNTTEKYNSTNSVSGGGTLLEVFVSAISSPSRFWLQIVGPQVEKLDKLVEEMTVYYSNSENRDLHKILNVEVGQLVAAVFRHDGKWYRAKVAEIKTNEFDGRQQVCDVHFVDYGDNEYVAMEELLGLRTDMLQLRFQAVECFLAGVAPHPRPQEQDIEDTTKWQPKAIERFEELTQVARWKRLWSRTCAFKERVQPPSSEESTERNSREGSPIPGVKLYDVHDGVDIDIGKMLIDEGWATEVEEQPLSPVLSKPKAPTVPPSFGDLQSSRVLGMVVIDPEKRDREERAVSLPHAGGGGDTSSSNMTPQSSHNGSPMLGESKLKSTSLVSMRDDNKTAPTRPMVDLSYAKPNTTVDETRLNGTSHAVNGTSKHSDMFINAERQKSTPDRTISPANETIKRNSDSFSKQNPMIAPDPKDEFKAKMNRVDSHHGNLEALARSTPPPNIVSTPK